MFEEDLFLEDFTEPTDVQLEPSSSLIHIATCMRSIEAVDSIYNGRGLLSAPVAGVYRVEYADGSNHEILVMGDPANRDFRNARFLEKGRHSDQLTQILKLIIRGSKGAVPEMIKHQLYVYEADREQVNNNRRRYG